MANSRQFDSSIGSAELFPVSGGAARCGDAIALSVHGNTWHGDGGKLCKARLPVCQHGIALYQPETVAVGVGDYGDKVGVIKSLRCARIRSVVKMPVRRPHFPQESAKRMAMGLQTCDAPLAMQVVLVPQLVFFGRDGWSRGLCNVLDAITQPAQ